MHVVSLIYSSILVAFTLSALSTALLPSLRYLNLYGKTLEPAAAEPAESAAPAAAGVLGGLFAWVEKPVEKRRFGHFYVIGLASSGMALLQMLFCYLYCGGDSDGECVSAALLVRRTLAGVLAGQDDKLPSLPSRRQIADFLACALLCGKFVYLRQINDWAIAHSPSCVAELLTNHDVATPLANVLLATFLEACQCLRRRLECSVFDRAAARSAAPPAYMRMGHYVVGVVFYVGVATAVWIDSLDQIIAATSDRTLAGIFAGVDRAGALRMAAATALYVAAAASQTRSHLYLASLKKYTLPVEGPFRYLLCPHYTAEIAIYLALAVIVPTTAMKAVLLWTTVGLCVSSRQTRDYYEARFGADAVRGKWAVIPLVF
ncbi:uncharacterized protein V1510DRAFT_420924 [Dipodascopsis tothii]|uniref:uncharacterized protein n=1 Tax=Dipodascopsis tothii TaxID=44089 RepID=UPI0034CF9582